MKLIKPILFYVRQHIFRRQVKKTEARPRPNARGQLVKAKAEAKILASMQVWPS